MSRTIEWDGEGLPPVGTVCEFTGHTPCPEDPTDKDLQVGARVEIIAHFKDGDFDLAAFIFNPNNPGRGSAVVEQGAQGCFRPSRTLEQIAAEDREKAIRYLAAELGGHWSEEAISPQLKLAAYLHDIGYRKIEAGAT